MQPHRLLPEFDESLYIDNSVLLHALPEHIFEAADLSSGLCLPQHSFRATVMDEFAAVIEQKLDDPACLAEQLQDYRSFFPEILKVKPYWTGMLLRRHDHAAMVAAMDIWFAHICRYSRRDQLSANMAFHLAGLTPSLLPIDNYKSRFHEWPVIPDRKTASRIWHGDSSPADELKIRARMWQIEDQLAQLRYEHAVVLTSTTWRMMAPLHALLRRLRGIAS